MAVRNKNVMITDSGTGYVLPAQLNLANYNKNVNTGTIPKLGTINYGNVYVPPYANANAQLPPSMQDAIEQAKVNLGYVNASSTPSTNKTTSTTYSQTGNMSTKPDGMPTSAYNKYLEAQNKNTGNGAFGFINRMKDAASKAMEAITNNDIIGSVGGSGVGNGNAQAQSFYNNSIKALQDAYSQKLASLQSNLDSTRNVLKGDFDLSKNNLLANTEKALQEAYVNKMMNERSLEQQLNAQGLRGGATESAVASLLNNYGNSRNDINTAYSSNLAQLENAYLNNLAAAQQSYNDAVAKAASDNANYRLELERALYNAMLS